MLKQTIVVAAAVILLVVVAWILHRTLLDTAVPMLARVAFGACVVLPAIWLLALYLLSNREVMMDLSDEGLEKMERYWGTMLHPRSEARHHIYLLIKEVRRLRANAGASLVDNHAPGGRFDAQRVARG